MSIHKTYLLLTEDERAFVDDVFHEAFTVAHKERIPLNGGDEAERAVEAFSVLVMKSRKTT